MSVIDQSNRLLSLKTPLGTNQLILTRCYGEARLSHLFCYQLEAFSDNQQIAGNELIGKQVNWQIDVGKNNPNYFTGYVGDFFASALSMRGYRTYRLIIYPWLWFLTHTCNCRIFQQKSVIEILSIIFKEYSFSDYQFQIEKTYPKRDYCVQYNESDFAFMARLLEEEGIYYFFLQQPDKHTLVLADHNGAFIPCKDNELIYSSTGNTTRPHISQWERHYQFGSRSYSYTDFNFQSPSTSLFTTVSNKTQYANNQNYQIYEYPGNYTEKTEGYSKAKLRIESIEATQTTIAAASDCNTLAVGGKFKLDHPEHAREKGEYVITALTYEAQDNSHLAGEAEPAFYRNQFTCIPYEVPFRPLRHTVKPVVSGPQTAVVVGPQGEAIYTDEYGRVKIQFHWDRLGKKNEQSSCWVRVGQVWSGKQWGALFIPRIGQEVIVDFLEGNPDRPLIIGCVYNGEQKPIYNLPDNKWQTGIKTQSKNGFNELRMDDQENKEQFYLHAQKDFIREVENEDNLSVKGKQTITIIKDRQETLSEGDYILQIKQGGRNVKLDSGNDTLTLNQGNLSIQLNAGKCSIEAMQAIELKVGQNSIKIDNTGITLSGMMIKVEGQTMVKVEANAMLNLKGGITTIN